MEDFVYNLLTLRDVIGHTSEYKINLDTTKILRKYKHTLWGVYDNWSFSWQQNITDY